MGFIEEGHFISVLDDTVEPFVRRYYFVIGREVSHYETTWHDLEPAGPALTSGVLLPGPYIVKDLEPTLENQLYQVIFGFKPQIYLYSYLPAEVIRKGIAKRPRATQAFPTVGHMIEHWSPYDAPSFFTEHRLLRPLTIWMGFAAYNPLPFTVAATDLKINFIINECILEHVGDDIDGNLTAAKTRFTETLEKLQKRVIPHKPLTLGPVRAPSVAPARPIRR